MRRLALLLRCVVLCLIGLLVACTSPTPDTTRDASPSPAPQVDLPVTLTIWHSWSGSKLDALSSIARSYEQANPRVRIRLVAQPATDIVSEYSRNVADGTAPQLVLTWARYLGELAERQSVATLDGVFNETELSPLLPTALENARVGGQLYAVPVTYDGLVLFYDRRRIPEPPATMSQLLEATTAHPEETPETRPWSLGYHLSAETTLPYLIGFGGALTNDQGQPRFVSEGRASTLRWLEWLKEVQSHEQALASHDYSIVDGAIQEGRVWSAIDWSYRRTNFAQVWGTDAVGIAPLPGISAEIPQSTLVLPEVICINPVSSTEQQLAAQSFLRYLIDRPAQETLWSRGQILPAYQFDDAPPELGTLRSVLQNAQPLPNSIAAPGVWQPFATLVRSVITNAATAPEAIDTAQSSLQRSQP